MNSLRKVLALYLLFGLLGARSVGLVSAAAQAPPTPTAAVHSAWIVQEFMVPMRDGIRLQTTVIRKPSDTRTLPILLRRTPYGVPTQETCDTLAAKNHDDGTPVNWRELAADGYIFVVQNLRGRFNSEGTFLLPRASTRTTRNRPMKRTTPTTPSTGSSRMCPATTVASASTASPTTD